jgi:dolichyl-phosphate-mannose--protein O-mannosyl transferase
MTDWLNPWASHWTTWFVPLRPMPLVFMKVEKHVVRVMTSLPNLAILWTSSVLGVVSFCRIATLGPRRFLARLDGSGFFAGEDLKAVGWLTLLWILPLVPWMVTYRDSYFNHYLPSYVFAVILLAGGASRLVRARPVLGWVFIAIVLAVFVAYAPVWGELPIRRRTWRALMFLGSWR